MKGLCLSFFRNYRDQLVGGCRIVHTLWEKSENIEGSLHSGAIRKKKWLEGKLYWEYSKSPREERVVERGGRRLRLYKKGGEGNISS